MQCLNLNIKEVKAAVDELTTILGNEDAAYYIISENNGYAIDQAPNGAQSKLFSDLLSHFNGNREQAIRAKAKTFTEGFKMRLGESQEQSIQDENGEYTIEQVIPTTSEPQNVNKKEESKPKLNKEYHPAEEFTSFYITNNGYDNTTSGELVNRMQMYLPKHSLARKLLNLFKNTDVPVVFYRLGLDEDADYMYYSPERHNIVVNVDKFNRTTMGYNSQSIMHDIVHAFTTRTLVRIKSGQATAQEKMLYDKLVELHKQYQSKYDSHRNQKGKFTDEFYGLTDIDEFAAELLTNRSFMNVLKYDIHEDSNFWDTLKAICRLLLDRLGLTQSEVDSLYNDLFDLVTYNVEQDITEQDFIDTDSDLIARQDLAVRRMQSASQQAVDSLKEDTVALSKRILTALQSRLKTYHDNDPVIQQQVKNSMEQQVANITNALVDEYVSISKFLTDADQEILRVTDMLVDAKKTGKVLDNDVINSLNEDFFTFYNPIVDDIVNRLSYRDEYRDVIGKDNAGNYKLDTLMKRARYYQSLLHEGKVLIDTQVALNARDIINQTGKDVGFSSAAFYKYDDSDASTFTRDISAALVYFGAGDKIKDDAIKAIFQMMNNAQDKSRQAKYAKAQQLKALLDKTNKYEQMQFFEVDDDGNTTGYFVRSRNFGKFEKEYKAEMDRICMDLGIDITDLNLPEKRQIRIKYNRRRNQWLSEHCERRFTAEYYEAFNHLSSEAQDQRESIQVHIRTLTNKGRDIYGIFRPENLTPDELKQLKQHQLQKKQLASIYDINGRKKTGIQLQVAEELTELNQKLSKGLLYQKNSKAYEEEKARIMSDKTLTKEQKQEWLDLNSREQYKEEFYQQLKRLATKSYGTEYAALQDRRRALLSMFRDDSTGEIDATMMPQSTKNALSAISRRMTQIRKSVTPTAVDGDYTFDEIAMVVPTKQWAIDKRRFYDAVIAVDPEAAQQWLEANSYTIKEPDGTVHTMPKSWYTKMVPRDKSMIERVANNNWMEVSKESPFYNKEYYQAQQDHPELKDEYWIPKKDLYNSEDRYNRIMNDPNKKALYEALLQTMAEANECYSNLNNLRPYRAPQISGSASRYIEAQFRKSKGLGVLAAPFRGYWQYLVDKMSVRNDDKGFNKALTKPNGERLNLIPQNYIARLETPEAINADIVSSVIEYYGAAVEWKNKKEIQPKVEILKSHMMGKKYLGKNNSVKNEESNASKFIRKFVDMNLYDIRQQTITVSIGGNESGKMLGVIPYKGSIFNLINYDLSKPREINITKMLSILRMLGTTRNLGVNFACALTGMFTALSGHITNVMVGRYYNPIDAARALRDICTDLLINVPNKFGLTTRQSQLSQKMEYFEVGANPMLNQTNMPQLYVMTKKHWAFGAYSLSDHIVKGQILASVMSNYKLVTIDGKKKFMSREAYKQAMGLPVFAPGDIRDWNFGEKLSFSDATEIVAGKLVAKDPANQEAVDAIKDEIGYTARTLAQSADGQLTDLQRSAIFANAMGQFMMMHRQYFPIILQERYTMTRQFDYQMKRYREAVLRTPVRICQEAQQDGINILLAFRDAYLHDPTARENIKKIAAEVTQWAVLNYLILPVLSSSADDDRRNWLLQLLVYSLERTSFEMMAGYNVMDLVNLIRNPSAIIDYFETATELASTPFDIIRESTVSLFTDQPMESEKIIRKGKYRGLTRRQKNAINLTPFRNIMTLRDLPGARQYYNKEIRGIDTRKKVKPSDEDSFYNFDDIDFDSLDFNFDK